MSTSQSIAPPDTVVLIHGLCDPARVGALGVPLRGTGIQGADTGIPGVEGGTPGVAALRADPACLANVGVQQVMDHLAEVVPALSPSRS